MELMLESGIDSDFLLGDSGDFALDESCCCGAAVCCGCEWLDDYITDAENNGCSTPPGKGRLKVTFAGAGLSGYVILGGTLGGIGTCLYWDNIQECGDFGMENLVNDCGWTINIVRFKCIQGHTQLSDFILEVVGVTSGGCDFRIPVFLDGECGPPLVLHYRSEATDVSGDGSCPGMCLGEILFTVESIDPWPLP